MGLSNDLISQFVKITKDKTDVKTETTVYGTTVEYNDKMYVKLDGSDLLTPIETTTDMKAGERVTVMIKDHTATVTGNLSSPAARTETVQQVASKVVEVEEVVATKATIKELEAETARINTLVSENVTIKDTLTATNAKIVNLEAEDVNISGKLTAAEADIEKLNADVVNIRDVSAENLEATNAKIYNLESTYATFDKATAEEFEAVHGTIDNLDSKYATIQNLDVAKGRIDDLEATRLTATSATIKNLQADVADIDTLIFGSASGNVIQSSFSNAVVAQLGNAMIKNAMIESVAADKVTAGNIYTNNVHVLSEDGRLIISDETIQISDENRVRVQIGKDASNDYSINIWDENGNLMFSEGGITDNAIKEAIIRNDMVSDDANISAKKLDIGSLFSTMNEDGSHTLHSSKVFVDADNQTLNVSFANMTTKVTTAQSTANTAQSSANNANNVATNALSAAVNAQDDIDNLEIGGRNLYIIKDSVSGFLTGGGSGGISSADPNNKERTSDYIDVTKNDNLVIQIWATPGSSYIWCGYEMYNSDLTISQDRQSLHQYELTGNTKQHYIREVTIPDGTAFIRVSARFFNDGKLKVEKGNKATDWTPAPEDVDASVNAAQSTANDAKNQANTNASNIASVTTKVTSQGTDLSVLKDQISSKIWQQDITNTVNNLEIGGRNLLKGTATPITPDGTGGTTASYNYAYGTYVLSTPLEANQEYMISADVEVLAGTVTNVTVVPYDSSTTVSGGGRTPTITNGRIETSYTPSSNYASMVKFLFYAGLAGSTSGKKVKFSNVKMEKGNKATDWTPAPEDTATTAEVNTLSTRYAEVKQTVDGLTSTVASHTTEINKKADGSTVATVNDKVSKLEQNLDGFKTTVSNTYSTKENLSDAIGNLNIGGRNYIILGKLSSHTPYNTIPTSNGNIISTTFLTGNTTMYLTLSISGFTPSKETYTLSGYIKVNGSIPTSNYFTSDRVSTYGTYISPITYDSSTGYFSCTQNYPGNSGWIIHALTRRVSGAADVVTFEKLKFEKGTKATDWTPAPEDVDADISALEGRVTNTETSITQTSNSITSLATRTTAVEGVAANAYSGSRRQSGTIDLTDTSKYNINTYYPVVCNNQIPASGYHLHEVNVQLNSGSKPSWSTHTNGFSCNLSCRMKSAGWGTVNSSTLGWIDDFGYNWCDKMPAYIQQNTNASRAIFYLRGGGKYFLYTNYDCTWTVHTTTVTLSDSTSSPTTTPSNHASLVNNWETVSRLGTAETKIIQTADSITSLADKTVVLENKFGQYPTTAEMNSAITQKADSITSTVAATYTTKIDSAYEKLGNLVKNGYGEYMDATGWSGTTYTRGDCPEGCHGYICNGTTIDKIPYDPTKVYDYEYYVRLHSGRSGQNYFSVQPLDVDGNIIKPECVPSYTDRLCYLSKALNNGDTVMYFTDLSKWDVGTTASHQRSIIVFGYTDSTGYTYPDGTYSRKTYMEVYADNSSVNQTAKTITLKSAWTGGTVAAGTCVCQTSSGSVYCYYGQAGNITHTDWRLRTGEITAIANGNRDQRRLTYAKYIKVGLWNNVADYAGICIREQTTDKVGRSAAEEAKSIADEAKSTSEAAQSSIEQLKDQISMLVINGDKGSMMTQTADGGWQFNMGTVNTTIDGLSDDVKNVKEQSDKTDANVSDLDKRITGLEEVTEYVHIGTYTEPDTGAVVPSIDLGEGDSDFKLKITNKEIVFTNGSTEPAAYIDSVDQIFEIGQAEIRTDLRIGNIVFAKRPNGNVGISWKEV